MGASSGKDKEFNESEWVKEWEDQNGRVYANRRNPQVKVTEHSFKAKTEKEYKKAIKLYNVRKDSRSVVKTLYKDIQSDGGCSGTYSGHVYTEWIPITLENFSHIPFPDILHVYKQSLDGTEQISDLKGPYLLTEAAIGVNN